MEGSCNCGAVSVTIKDDELFTKRRGHICHCQNCRKTAGSAWASNLAIEEEKVTIKGADNLTTYQDTNSLSGNTVHRSFCKTCGNPIKSVTVAMAGKAILKTGIFEKIPAPEFETFAKERMGWEKGFEDVPAFKIGKGGEKLE